MKYNSKIMHNNHPAISIFTTDWGHKSIAQAVMSALKKSGHKIYFNHIPAEKLSARSYKISYQILPTLYNVSYKISENKNIQKVVTKYLNKKYQQKIQKSIDKQTPGVVISTYFGFNDVLEKISLKKGFLFINVVPDPRTIHNLTINKSAYNFVFDKKASQMCKKNKVAKDKSIISGWFVRERFFDAYDKIRVREKLNLKPDIFNVCVVGGSEGAYSMLKVVPALIDVKKPVEIVFICGNNKNLLRSVKTLRKFFTYVDSKVSIIPIGFTDKIEKYIQASDLLIGKAGPNLLFETVATKTPFFSIFHIPGQETGNLEIIKKYRLGYVEENHVKAIKLVRKIIHNPKMLNGFEKPLTKMADYNKGSYETLRGFIKEKTDRELR